MFNDEGTNAIQSSSTLDVTRLPEWNCIDTNFIAVFVMTLRARDKEVKVLFKKREGLWGTPSPLDIRFLIVVHRDISTIQIPKTIRLLGYSSELDKEQNEVDHVAC